MSTCRVNTAANGWDGERGIDHVITCLERAVPDYATYFPTRSASLRPSAFSEEASEPSTWSASDIGALWRYNLYGSYTSGGGTGAALAITIQGPSELASGQVGTWVADVSGGSGTPTYQWHSRSLPSGCSITSTSSSCGSWINGGTSSQFSRTMPSGANLGLRLTVARGGQTATEQDVVYNHTSVGP